MPQVNTAGRHHDFPHFQETSSRRKVPKSDLFTAIRPYVITFVLAILLLSIWALLRAA
jgi:hypothetical protein